MEIKEYERPSVKLCVWYTEDALFESRRGHGLSRMRGVFFCIFSSASPDT
jgi:hypothetical protein